MALFARVVIGRSNCFGFGFLIVRLLFGREIKFCSRFGGFVWKLFFLVLLADLMRSHVQFPSNIN